MVVLTVTRNQVERNPITAGQRNSNESLCGGAKECRCHFGTLLHHTFTVQRNYFFNLFSFYIWSGQMDLFTTSLLHLPVDVLQNLILAQLNSASILACSFTCSYLRRISSRLIPNHISHRDRQREILKDIFRFGSLELLVYFQKHMNYPNLYPSSQLIVECLDLAGEGI